jgi:SAM-dependent methyltransferase
MTQPDTAAPTTDPPFVYDRPGHCPICAAEVRFRARAAWFRDHLFCSDCGSIPRERGLALVLERRFPGWRGLAIHESSPADRGISKKLAREAPGYVSSQFFPGEPLGATVRGFRNENLEALTFADASFDLTITLDVMEHVNQPDQVLREVARTLKPGGAYIFTVPTYKGKLVSERRAHYRADGGVDHLVEPEYHGNPVSDAGSLVTFHYGHDFAEMIAAWSGLDVEVVRFHDHRHGVIGDFTEVYVATRPTSWKSSPAVSPLSTRP